MHHKRIRPYRVAVLAPYVGIKDRGAETFVLELVQRIKDQFDIFVFSNGYICMEGIHIYQIHSPCPRWVLLYASLINTVKSFSSRAGGRYIIFIIRGICRKIIRQIEKTIYLSPPTIEQFYFTRRVFTKYIRHERFDIVFPNNGIWGAIYARNYRNKNNIPFICIGHGGIGGEEKKILQTEPDRYIATTAHSARWAREYYGKIVHLRIGVTIKQPLEPFSPLPEHERLDRPIVLCVGAFVEFKRQYLLVNAMSYLGKGILILLGKGELEHALVKYCNAKLPGRYIITCCPYTQMEYFYRLCDIFSLPSRNEPFGIVYLEAMAANKPVVTVNDDSRRSIVGPAGIFCDVEDEQKYAAAIEVAYRTQWGRIPLEHVEALYDWRSIAQQYADMFTEVIGESKGGESQ